MHTYELLIHIGASSTVKDDNRWRAVTQKIAEFRSVRSIAVHGDSIHAGANAPAAELKDQPAVATQERALDSRDSLSVKNSDIADISDNRLTSNGECGHKKNLCRQSKRVHSSIEGQYSATSKRARLLHNQSPEIPSLSPNQLELKDVLPQCTPLGQTAASPTILVPQTKSLTGRRELVDVTTNRFPASREVSSGFSQTSHVDETSFAPCTDSATESLEIRPFDQPELTNDLPDSVAITQHFHSSLEECQIGIGTIAGPDRLERRGSGQAVSCTSLLSFVAGVSPSSSMTEAAGGNSPLASRGTCIQYAAYSSSSQIDNVSAAISRGDVLTSVNSPAVLVTGMKDTTGKISNPNDNLRRLQQLPKSALCTRLFAEYSSFFASHITPHLSDLAKAFNLTHAFQPEFTTLRIRNCQRGFWKLSISIGTTEAVLQARQPLLKLSPQSQRRSILRQGILSGVDTTPKHGLVLRNSSFPPRESSTTCRWTTDDFIGFWSDLHEFIESGRAGYDVFAQITSLRCLTTGNLEVEVRVHCYGQVLSHLWLVLHGLSNGLTADLALQFCGPGSVTLLTMSARGTAASHSRRWEELESGVKGFWGFRSG